MRHDVRSVRERAVPWDPEPLVGFYHHSHPLFSFREEVLKLMLNAHRLFVLGFPNASMLMAGEGLLRVIYDRIAVLITQRGRVHYGNINGRQPEPRARAIGAAPHNWNDRITFH